MASTDPTKNLEQAVKKARETMSETEVRRLVESTLNEARRG